MEKEEKFSNDRGDFYFDPSFSSFPKIFRKEILDKEVWRNENSLFYRGFI